MVPLGVGIRTNGVIMLWQLSPIEWLQSFAFIASLSYILGWFSNLILHSNGFGHVGNWLVILLGSYAGLYVYNLQGYRIGSDPSWSMAIVFLSALAALILGVTAKRLVLR